jgi:hypothetical protein
MKRIIWLAALIAFSPAQAANSDGKAAPTAAADGTISGKVVETMNAATYTYVLIDTGSGKTWAAAPQFIVKVGDKIVVADGMPMKQYQSKTLNRTFDVVYFSGDVRVNGQPAAATPARAATSAAPALPDLTNIKRAEGGQTVAEVFAGKEKLAGQPIAVRARVVKYNAQILGKNWLHVRDGSGAEGTNDLTVTTSATVKVGDLVLVTGKLATNRDFGSGYSYAVIVEDANVVAQ